MARRPRLITIFAALCFVATAQYATLALLWLAYRPALVAYLHALSPGGSGPEKIHIAMGRFEPVYYVILAVVMALVGRGLWKLQNWTRVFMLAIVGISLIGVVATSKLALGSGSAGAIALWLLRFGLCLIVSWYLLSSEVQSAFRSRKREQPLLDHTQQLREVTMRRFSFPVVTLAMSLAVVAGIAVFGMLATTVPNQPISAAGALSKFATQAVLIVALGAAAGLLAWIVVFAAKRDGWHRMEWLAFLPSNYGGKSPFDVSEPSMFR